MLLFFKMLSFKKNSVQIAIVFGGSTLEHIFNLCRGNFDFLVRLPDALLLYIVSFLDLEDIARLTQVSHRFEKVKKCFYYITFKFISRDVYLHLGSNYYLANLPIEPIK